MKIAVVGAGLFGVSAAIELSKIAEVTLFDKESDILRCASGINQYRLHAGYHYPRSPETVKSMQNSLPSFLEVYGDAVLRDYKHYYCIAAEESVTSAEQFLSFCKAQNLNLEIEDCGIVKSNSVHLCVRVNEHLIDPLLLYKICWRQLKTSGVAVRLNTAVRAADLDEFDSVAVCAYARINDVLSPSRHQENYQFEVCEKIVLRLPQEYLGKSVVVLDGPFMCIDPFGNTGNFVMGHVVHAIHETNVGRLPKVNASLATLLHRGIIHNPTVSHYDKFIASASRFFHGIEEAQYIGSMFVIRSVFPDTDDTDARPTIITNHDDRVFTVFSGKWVDCVNASRLLAAMIGERIPSILLARPVHQAHP